MHRLMRAGGDWNVDAAAAVLALTLCFNSGVQDRKSGIDAVQIVEIASEVTLRSMSESTSAYKRDLVTALSRFDSSCVFHTLPTLMHVAIEPPSSEPALYQLAMKAVKVDRPVTLP